MKASIVLTRMLLMVVHKLLARLHHFSSLFLMILMPVTTALQAFLSLLFIGLVFLTSGSSTLIDMLEIFW
uniref:Uncharacterized protein n=1 Tax=Arundo donax TaxID=35708 RepID=A0A0A9DW26_ARUDO